MWKGAAGGTFLFYRITNFRVETILFKSNNISEYHNVCWP